MSRFHGNNDARQKRDRAAAAALLPCPCYRCGLPVTADMPWDVDHDPPRSQPGSRMVGPSHRSCNRRHGDGTRRRKSIRGALRSW
jgi:hypothetical protein